jgi:hypothetical protein
VPRRNHDAAGLGGVDYAQLCRRRCVFLSWWETVAGGLVVAGLDEAVVIEFVLSKPSGGCSAGVLRADDQYGPIGAVDDSARDAAQPHVR